MPSLFASFLIDEEFFNIGLFPSIRLPMGLHF